MKNVSLFMLLLIIILLYFNEINSLSSLVISINWFNTLPKFWIVFLHVIQNSSDIVALCCGTAFAIPVYFFGYSSWKITYNILSKYDHFTY